MDTNEELDFNLDDLNQIEANSEKKLQVRNRFQDLANAKTEAQQKADAEAKARAEAEARLSQVEKERDFHKNFSQISSKYPQAVEYQDQILERVNKGYDVEEATLGLLAKEGKLQAQPSFTPEPLRPEGGSSLNSFDGPKGIPDMSSTEMLDSLKDLEKTGELNQALRGGINLS